VSLVYFDASALVKLVVREEGSELSRQLWDGGDAVLSSRLAFPEVCAALARAERNHVLDRVAHRRARRWWERLWAAVRPVELSGTVTARGGELATSHPLSGADAIHLASAEALGVADVVVATWDRRLHTAARHHGFSVAPATLT
jgi:predicted nucleic acid-binding protein